MMMDVLPPPLPPTANASGLAQVGMLCPDTSPDLQGYVEIRPGLGEIPASTHFLVAALSAILVAASAGYYVKKLNKRSRRSRR